MVNRLYAIDIDDYWSTDPIFYYSPVTYRIPRDRSQEISRYLHFVDNTTLVPQGSPGYDHLGKVWPVIDHLSKRFVYLYEPDREVAANKTMIKFTGHSSVKQYKPINWGIKVHSITISLRMCTCMYMYTNVTDAHISLCPNERTLKFSPEHTLHSP